MPLVTPGRHLNADAYHCTEDTDARSAAPKYLSFNPNAGSTTNLVCASRSFVELPRITRHAVTHGTQRTALVMAPTCTSETAKRPKEG